MIEKGLVSWVKENDKRYYIAENPKRLSELIDIQKEEIDKILPILMANFTEKGEKQETKFYRGVEGIKSIFEDQIEETKPVYIIGAAYNAEEILKYYLPHYTSKRVKKKLKLYLIYCSGKDPIKVPYEEARYLPSTYASMISTNVYADKVAIIVWSHEPVAILIKNKSISGAYKKYFDLLWKTAKKI